MDTYARMPVSFSKGSGAHLWDTSGKSYLDMFSGIAVASLGHANESIADTISEQAHRLCHVSNVYGNELGEELADRIDALVRAGYEDQDHRQSRDQSQYNPARDGSSARGRVFLCNSGAEANECAIKLARKWKAGATSEATGERGAPGIILATEGSFHGRTLATWAASGKSIGNQDYEPLPGGFSHVPYNDIAALEDRLSVGDVSAFLVEPIQGENGVVEPDGGYLAAARELCSRYGALLIVDEVQTGLAKTGKWFAFQYEDILPDIVTVAKALGNGMPIGACWARAEVASAFRPGDHGSTFGGQPLACAAAIATLKIMQEIEAPSRAMKIGIIIDRRLTGLKPISSLSGRGALRGITLDGDRASDVAREALERGLLVNAPRPGVIRIAPPLIITDEELESALGILASSIEEVFK